MVYRAQGRADASNRVIEQMLKRTRTLQAFELAGKLWTMFGEGERAEAARVAQRRAQAELASRGRD